MNMLTQPLLPELEFETPATRKTLERVPEKFDWTPHGKSMNLGRLAQHLAEIKTLFRLLPIALNQERMRSQ